MNDDELKMNIECVILDSTGELNPADSLCVGGEYNWINQPERLVYLGHNWSSNGYWHQFAKVESPKTVWCEVLYSDLKMIEKTLKEKSNETTN